ncbi:hypothetical protein KO488_01280 [Poseidonibacter lekithochrous]|jgi:hypothetical protein|uniref:hypothetical protein n=1 Tax=Poseidonibacter TaxID=2321187 RepID=UPI001C09A994|nr:MULTISPECIES: hypothetical protein [Poseidonibacter]MBU3013370.1 hypothetical protein [Poseidonibacter lekithochrous]MDO6826667.1 hypothetical protein [Poseidonibacter sp. 1_MG-2023]
MKILMISLLAFSALFSEATINMKKCELLEMSQYTKLFSCHKIDYLVEYKIEADLSEEDSIKKITMITPTTQKVIKTGK